MGSERARRPCAWPPGQFRRCCRAGAQRRSERCGGLV